MADALVGSAPPRWLLGGVLASAVLAFSAAAPLVRLVEAPSATVALGRVAISAALLGVLLVFRGERIGRGAGTAALAGVLLALHFWSWFASLSRTSVLSSTLLVTLSPLWVALASRWIPGESRLTWRGWGGVLLALSGAVYVVTAGAEGGQVTRTGLALALLGGVLAAAYFLVSRRARATMPLVPYALAANSAAALTLLPVVLWSGVGVGAVGPLGWLALFALALLPQLVGHNGLAWALRWVPTTTVSLTVLLEPLGASMLAAMWLRETPQPVDLIGGALILVGLGVVVRSPRSEKESE